MNAAFEQFLLDMFEEYDLTSFGHEVIDRFWVLYLSKYPGTDPHEESDPDASEAEESWVEPGLD